MEPAGTKYSWRTLTRSILPRYTLHCVICHKCLLTPRYKALFAAELSYPPTIAAVKISTLLLFGRIFPDRKLRRFLWAIGIFVSTYTAITTLTTIFQCRPIKGAWDPTLDADCIQIKLVYIVMGSMNVLTDFALLFAPLPQLWNLQIRRDTKIELIGIFSIGGLFVTFLPWQKRSRNLYWLGANRPTASPSSQSTASSNWTVSPSSIPDGPTTTPPSGRLWRSPSLLCAPPPSPTVPCSTGSSASIPPRPGLLPPEWRGRALSESRISDASWQTRHQAKAATWRCACRLWAPRRLMANRGCLGTEMGSTEWRTRWKSSNRCACR